MNGVTFSMVEGIAEARFEFGGREWTGIGVGECEALNSLLVAMAIDFDLATSAPLGFDIECFLAESAGRSDALAYDLERSTERVEELEVLNTIMAQQYGDELARLVEQRNNLASELVNARIKIAHLEDQVEMRQEMAQ